MSSISQNNSNVKAFDKRTLAGKRRKLAQTKAPEAMLTLLDTAVSAGLSAEYVLFDSWFSNPALQKDNAIWIQSLLKEKEEGE